MTPPAVDWRALQAKLRRMQDLLDQLRDVGPLDAGRLVAEPLTALAVERILTLLVDLAFTCNSHVVVARLGRAPDSYADSFDLAARTGMVTEPLARALRPSAGLRNVLVHEYVAVDRTVVVAAVPVALEQYGRYVQQVAAFAQRQA